MNHESRVAKALRTLNTPARRAPIVWTGARIQEELAKSLLPLARRQRRELEERRELEREARQIRSLGPAGDVAQARLARIAVRIAEITPEPEPTRRQRREYRKRLAEELADLRRRADRFDHDPAWAEVLARETLAERRAQLAERRRAS
ncbi:hypothetical protein TVNIR_2098 [Thioalkalivibrio nitratireducens DSM 14787]|uniref:Uncharacterized protein n=1 Tax=Thioalkalivibrio nitratireducens (strain DSM 14787 / UNIQEM 213 / ALEN2) TaxID=1255043 RepID=L0DXI8_THIND|nr:hypothetical protein [Thioalkalivibrio nitratireducens]AGA33758.1 hypothetical protein TVNIR_2098 [Thioalkalivibrio nitratireducens DSM 14787]